MWHAALRNFPFCAVYGYVLPSCTVAVSRQRHAVHGVTLRVQLHSVSNHLTCARTHVPTAVSGSEFVRGVKQYNNEGLALMHPVDKDLPSRRTRTCSVDAQTVHVGLTGQTAQTGQTRQMGRGRDKQGRHDMRDRRGRRDILEIRSIRDRRGRR